MTDIDVSSWASTNVWRHSSGELCVRPGLRRLYTPTQGEVGARALVGGFSVVNGYTPEVWHYVFDVAQSGSLDLKLRVLDWTFQTVQVLSVNADMVPRVITCSIVEGQALICSPDFPTLFFMVGIGGVRTADSVVSTNPSTTAIPVPRGVSTVWCNRVVICDGRSMFVSDPVTATGGDVRTFVAENQNQRPGFVFGVHEGAGDSLVCVTSAGVYALESAAAAVGIVGSNGTAWRLVNHNVATSYASSCAVRGRIYGLTRDGYTLVDTEGAPETFLSEPLMPRALFTRISLEDYRSCRMYPSDEGPMVAAPTVRALHRTDTQRDLRSWWRSSTFTTVTFNVVGTLRDLDGTEMLITSTGVFAMAGDFDGEVALTSEVGAVTGSLFGAFSESNVYVTYVDIGAAVGGEDSLLSCAVRGSLKTREMPSDANGFIIDTDTWDLSIKRLTTTPVKSCRFSFGAARCAAGDDIGVEIGVQGCLSRISTQMRFEVNKAGLDGRPAVVE